MNGARVPILEGQTKDEAAKSFLCDKIPKGTYPAKIIGEVRKTRVYPRTKSNIRSSTFTDGYSIDFERTNGTKGKIRDFSKTEVNKWLRNALEANEIDKEFAAQIRKKVKEL